MSDEIYRDQPTGLYNRRYLDEVLPDSIHAWIQAGESFTLVMVDLDHFKTVNDQYGHARGDAVLKSFAGFLRESTRTTDHVIRYGGDEFLCVLPNVRRLNAELLYERIIHNCHEKEFDGLSISISVGLASFPDDGMDYQQLFAMADASLYDAKRSGRNRLGTVQKKQINIPIKAFINRRDELGTLLHKIANEDNRLRVIVLNGNVGVGKSRLIRECLNLTKDYEIIWADCLLFSETIAYYAIRELSKYRMQRRGLDVFDELPLAYRLEIGKLVPEVLETIRDKFDNLDLVVDRYRLYESVRKCFEIGEQAKVVVIDNFQWIDKESLETLRYLFRSLKDTSNVFILLNRVEEVPGLVLDFLADINREVPIDEIELAPLQAPQIRECVRAVIGDESEDKLAEYAFQSSGGNPYFLEELFRGLAAGNYLTLENDQWQFRVPDVEIVPKSIELIAQRKYKLLSVEAQVVMRFASIIGQFDFAMLRHLTGYGESELRGLLAYISRAGVMRELRGKLVFVDEFSRRAIYRKFVSGPAAHELHRQVAEKLERDHLGRETDVLDDLAMNYYYAKVKDKGLKYCLLASRKAQEKYANEDAIRYYSWAEELLEGEKDIDARRYEILLAKESIYNIQGAREAQRRTLDTLSKLIESLDDDRRRTEVVLRQAVYAEIMANYPTAVVLIQEAIRLAQVVQDTRCEATGYLEWGVILWHQGDYNTAHLQLEQALTLALAAQLHKIEGDSLRHLGTVANLQGNQVNAIRYNEQALPIYREIGDLISESRGLNNLGILFNNLGDYSRSRSYLEQGLRTSREIGCRQHELSILNDMGLVLHHLGDDEASRRIQMESLVIGQEINEIYGQGYIQTYLGHALVGLGQLAEAADAYQQAAALRRELGQHNLVMDDLEGLARISMLQGNLTQAQAQVEEILSYLEKNTLEGSDDPSRVYLTCYRVLQACQDSRARDILETAYHELQEQAAKITDEELRRSFLQNVADHRGIVEEYSKIHNSPSQKRIGRR